jgi:hypothetical protein
VPELTFFFDESIAGQDRIEQLLNEIRAAENNDASASHPDQEGPRSASRDDDR